MRSRFSPCRPPGAAYACTQDNLCLLANQKLTVRGQRSKYLGTQGRTVVGFQEVGNLDSDFFFNFMIGLIALRQG